MSVAWWLVRAAECGAGALAEGLGRPFLSPGRLGTVAGGARPGGAWVHAASLGEVGGMPPLQRELESAAPGTLVYFTATSPSGLRRLEGLMGAGRAGMAPLDAPWIVGRFLDRLRPGVALLVETELWPHWLLALRRRGLPAALVSARLSPHSVAGYRRLGSAFRGLVRGVAVVLAQSEEDAARWVEAGADADRVQVTGNLKVDALAVGGRDRAAARSRLGLDPARPLFVLASARPGEGAPLARAWLGTPSEARSGWQVAVIPRHLNAARGLAVEIAAAGQPMEAGPPAGAARAWRMDPRLGVMADYYAAADLAFVGGSLAPCGGHNPLEPAAMGVAVVMGPHHAAQRPAVRALSAAGGLVVAADQDALRAALAALLGSEAERARRGAAAQACVRALQGVARRTVAALVARGLWPPP